MAVLPRQLLVRASLRVLLPLRALVILWCTRLRNKGLGLVLGEGVPKREACGLVVAS